MQNKFGSYSSNDVVFLLKDISHLMQEKSTQDREVEIQSGRHYSEMLPVEYKPSAEYKKLFLESLETYKAKVAAAAASLAEQIIKDKGREVVLVSLARAGTPIGVLLKRYIKYKYDLQLSHYSISIIRGRGLDENAMRHIWKDHPDQPIQFVDGWTGKGAIKRELELSLKVLNNKYNRNSSSSLAVLSDPGHCTDLFGTREDFLIPSACLNATVSGLVSRTVLNDAFISSNDFHGAKFYQDLLPEDLSNVFIDQDF